MGAFLSRPSAPTQIVSVAPSTTAEDQARKERLQAISRNRRGRLGLIATSERGVLSPTPEGSRRLLGE